MPKVTEGYRKKKQAEITTAAKRVFEKKGYTNTAMRDIMLEANISRGTLYSYFNNVEDVFLKVLALVDNQAFSNTKKADTNITFTKRLDEWVNKEVIELIRQPSLVQARAEYFFSLEDVTFFKERYNRLIEGFTSFLQKGVEAKEFFPKKNIKTIAQFMLSFVDGLMINTSQLDENSTAVKYQLDVFHTTLYNLLGLDMDN